jgi:hypothetical protein
MVHIPPAPSTSQQTEPTGSCGWCTAGPTACHDMSTCTDGRTERGHFQTAVQANCGITQPALAVEHCPTACARGQARYVCVCLCRGRHMPANNMPAAQCSGHWQTSHPIGCEPSTHIATASSRMHGPALVWGSTTTARYIFMTGACVGRCPSPSAVCHHTPPHFHQAQTPAMHLQVCLCRVDPVKLSKCSQTHRAWAPAPCHPPETTAPLLVM